jgi:Ni,Fe-hydrogenase III large subunit
METKFLKILNGFAVSRSKIPHLSFTDFSENALNIVKSGGKVVHFFGYKDGKNIKLIAILRTNELFIALTDAPDSYPSFTSECEQFHMFEREIAEQFGIKPEGHPWLKMVRYHPNYTGKPDVFGNNYKEDIPGNYDYYKLDGDEVHEVAVGPVHAGVIEPGHFRFNCIGERVFHLEIQLGYQHRGVENLLENVDNKRLPIIAESIAGDTTVANCTCMSQTVEALTNIETDKGSKIIRTIALELERIANHTGDLGALSGDVAFLPPANYFGRMRGDFLNMTLLICGNRLGKGVVRPGGVRFSINDDIRSDLMSRINVLEPQMQHVIDLLFGTPSVRSRFEGCGTVSNFDAEKLGLVGPAGRACGIQNDIRRDFPTEHYPHIDIPEYAEPTCDVYARARIRADEIMQSIKIIKSLLENNIKTKTVDFGDYNLSPASFVVTVNEAWRGELSHCVLTDENGKIVRYKVKDPSFHNWNGLSMSLRDTGISDFPLNNKSFNLSYCGFDL